MLAVEFFSIVTLTVSSSRSDKVSESKGDTRGEMAELAFKNGSSFK